MDQRRYLQVAVDTMNIFKGFKPDLLVKKEKTPKKPSLKVKQCKV